VSWVGGRSWGVVIGVTLAVWGGVVLRQRVVDRRPEPRAVWVWSDRVMREAGARDSLFDWARRHGVHRIYQHVEPLLLQDAEAVATFFRQSRVAGFVAEALLGDPSWAIRPDSLWPRYRALLGLHDRLGTDTLTAVHLDVEPHTAPDWSEQESTYVAGYQRLIEGLRAERGTRTLPLRVDIPSWYDRVIVGGQAGTSLAAWLFPRVDGVTLMAYFTDARRLWREVDRERVLARAWGTPLTIGVETSCAVGAAQSFCTLGRRRLEGMLSALRQHLRGDPEWQGTAIHAYPAVVPLLP
jgi:hypothetical protein